MYVELLAHSQLTEKKRKEFQDLFNMGVTDGKLVGFSAIRNCYSAVKPSKVIAEEGKRYLTKAPVDNGSGTDMDRLIRHIVHSGHTSTLEHISFTFIIEDVSRALLAQLTRHRVGWSYSVESQRYVNYKSSGKAGGFNYTIPDTLTDIQISVFEKHMSNLQTAYDDMIGMGIKAEDARAILPQATNTNIVVTCNLTSFLSFYSKRKPGTHAQGEIQQLAIKMKDEIVAVEPWTEGFFV
jgi:thymidylate synthase (FAD)